MGATTVWERWDSLLPDGDVNPGTMTSFNHYALGAVADWLHRVVGGLAPAAPGYRVVRFAPQPGGGLTSASARHRTPYGEASIAWQVEGDRLVVEVRVPVGATGVLELPGIPPETLAHGTHRREAAYVVSAVESQVV
jgi:alpha-L-rhamnosidase